MGGTTSPLTGLKTGKVERGHEISRFLDMLRSSLLDFWMELWCTSWMLEGGRGSDVGMRELVVVSSICLPHPVRNILLTETDWKCLNRQSVRTSSSGSLSMHSRNLTASLTHSWESTVKDMFFNINADLKQFVTGYTLSLNFWAAHWMNGWKHTDEHMNEKSRQWQHRWLNCKAKTGEETATEPK